MAKSKKQPLAHVVDVERTEDEDDEEISEDGAFNSDDQRKYGSFFESKHSGGDDSSDEGSSQSDEDGEERSDSDDEEEGDAGQYMLNLLERMDDGRPQARPEKQNPVIPGIRESEFSSSVVPKAGLTLDSLMKGLETTAGFGVMQKRLQKVAQGSATTAPLARRISDRVDRQVRYKEQSKSISHWIDAVQQNRQAETLDFRPKERLDMTRDALVANFVPTTPFEKQLHAALQEAGQQDEEAILKSEEAALQVELGSNAITLEEYRKRRGELAKMRALMFYHEQKRHHINKIKSKKYRSIRKRQREKQKGAELEAEANENEDLVRELEEKEEAERAKERMTLAHKNTSKWARRVLKRGKNVDLDTRRALSAQLKRGDDLLRKMKVTRAGNDSEEEDGEEGVVEAVQKILEDAELPVQGSGLFKLSFMQRGIERQRQLARAEARQLLDELRGDDDLDTGGEDEEDPQPKASKPPVASKAEMEGILDENGLVATSLRFGNSDEVAVSGEIAIGANVRTYAPISDLQQAVSVYEAETRGIDSSAPVLLVSHLNPAPQPKATSVPQPTAKSSEVNPWLNQRDVTSSGTKKGRATGLVDVESAIDILESANWTPQLATMAKAETNGKKITVLSQEELVKRAFASISEKEAEETFEKEKADVEDTESSRRKHKKEKDMNVTAGWGSWTGEGAPSAKPPGRFPKHLEPPAIKPAKRKRADAGKPQVIISEKRVKKTADNFMITKVPYPYTSREEYERAMAGAVGPEWNVTSSFKDMTRPEIITRTGKIIQPISKKAKQRRPPAKF